MMGKHIESEDTEFKNRHDELKLYRAAIEAAPIAISMAGADGSHFYHNRSFKKMFGYDVEELAGSSFETLCADITMGKIHFNEVGKKESWTQEIEMVEKSGKKMHVMVRTEAIKDDGDTIIAFLSTYTDITEQKKHEKELKYQHEYLSTLQSISLGMFRRLNLSELLKAILVRASKISLIPNGFLYLYDPEQNMLEIKAACGNLSDHIGLKLDPGKDLAGKVFETGEPIIVDDYPSWSGNRMKPLSDHIVSIVGIPLVSGSKVIGVIGLSHSQKESNMDPETIIILEEFAAIARIAIDNATLFESQRQEFEKRIALEKERKQMEVKLHQSQRMEAIGTLAGGIAHDFNNILSAIMGFTQIAQVDVEKGSDLEDDLSEIYTASLRAKDLVQQILTFARQSDEKVNAIKVSIIVKEVLKFIRSSIPTTITIEQKINSTSKVFANPTQVYQVFLNLFTNSAQAMDKEGGVLRVDLTEERLDESQELFLPGRYLKAVISDTGVGIAKEHLHTIFDPYFTTKQIGEGTGLGLAVVHGAVKSMAGDIFVESEEGKGAKFTIYLPVAKKIEQEDSDKEAELPQGKLEHILFVDDEITITKLGKKILEGLNYKVTVLNDSLEALEFFKSAPDDVNVIITDMTMPNMTGDKLAEEAKKIRPDIPVVLCTGFSKYISDTDVKRKAINYYCKKPISREDFATVIRKAVDDKV